MRSPLAAAPGQLTAGLQIRVRVKARAVLRFWKSHNASCSNVCFQRRINVRSALVHMREHLPVFIWKTRPYLLEASSFWIFQSQGSTAPETAVDTRKKAMTAGIVPSKHSAAMRNSFFGSSFYLLKQSLSNATTTLNNLE
jgi:hypothetical protein